MCKCLCLWASCESAVLEVPKLRGTNQEFCQVNGSCLCCRFFRDNPMRYYWFPSHHSLRLNSSTKYIINYWWIVFKANILCQILHKWRKNITWRCFLLFLGFAFKKLGFHVYFTMYVVECKFFLQNKIVKNVTI